VVWQDRVEGHVPPALAAVMKLVEHVCASMSEAAKRIARTVFIGRGTLAHDAREVKKERDW